MAEDENTLDESTRLVEVVGDTKRQFNRLSDVQKDTIVGWAAEQIAEGQNPFTPDFENTMPTNLSLDFASDQYQMAKDLIASSIQAGEDVEGFTSWFLVESLKAEQPTGVMLDIAALYREYKQTKLRQERRKNRNGL